MICSREGCDNEFVPTTHNNIFCSDECCKIATLEKSRRANKERRDRLSGKKRFCANDGCNSPLSRYTEESICEYCKVLQKKAERQSLLDMIGYS